MDLLEYITSARDRATPGAEQLRDIGKRAASDFLANGRPLNEGVAEMAKQSGLNQEQVRRACEHANNEAFVGLFRAGKYDRNIAFDMADADAVATNISPEHPDVVVKTSARKPTTERHTPGQEAVSFENMFGYRPGHLEKRAAAERDVPTQAEVARQYLSLKDLLRQQEADQFLQTNQFNAKLAELRKTAAQSLKEGEPVWSVAAAVEHANPAPGLYRVIRRELGSMLDVGGLRKMAEFGYEMAPEDPIEGLVVDLERVAEKLVSTEEASMRTRDAIDELLVILRGPPQTNPTADLFAQDPVPPQAMPQAGGPQPGLGMPPMAPSGAAPMQPQPGPPVR